MKYKLQMNEKLILKNSWLTSFSETQNPLKQNFLSVYIVKKIRS